MSSPDTLSIHPSLTLIFPMEANAKLTDKDNNLYKEAIDPDTAWHYYSHSIRRNPTNLNLHTHRVFFAMQHKDAALLPGSLHDLFFVLKDAGEKLRIRLLKASLPYLSKKDTLYFAMWIKTGIKNGMGYQWVNGSVLADGLYGPDHDLVTMHQKSVEALTPLEEARASMENGQLDIAQLILIRALEEDPKNSILTEELDYLNDYTKSREIHPKKPISKNKIGSAFGRLKERIFS